MTVVSVLIVNYNTADLVKKCIESVLNQQDIDFEVIVIDNASQDHSVEALKQFGSAIKVIANQENLGFGKANNQAFHASTGRYLFLLNPDAIFLTNRDLAHAVHYMENHTACGLAGTTILDVKNQITDSASRHYPRQNKTRAGFSKLPGEWATVLGASMMIRRDVFEKVKGFDEDFFLYAEETDICLRIRQQGYTIDYMTEVAVKHVGGASERKNPPQEVSRKKKRGKYLFYSKHYPKADVIKLIKSDLRHARFHLLRLWVAQKLFGLNQDNQLKLARHQVTCDVAKEFLV